MTHNIIKSLAALIMGALLLTSCGKDNNDNDAFIGKWANTPQSYEITISGQEYLPEGCICMEFTNNKVKISDLRRECHTEYKYTLSEKDGKQLLEIKGNGGCYAGEIFVVEDLTSNELVLSPKYNGLDWDFRYILKRY